MVDCYKRIENVINQSLASDPVILPNSRKIEQLDDLFDDLVFVNNMQEVVNLYHRFKDFDHYDPVLDVSNDINIQRFDYEFVKNMKNRQRGDKLNRLVPLFNELMLQLEQIVPVTSSPQALDALAQIRRNITLEISDKNILESEFRSGFLPFVYHINESLDQLFQVHDQPMAVKQEIRIKFKVLFDYLTELDDPRSTPEHHGSRTLELVQYAEQFNKIISQLELIKTSMEARDRILGAKVNAAITCLKNMRQQYLFAQQFDLGEPLSPLQVGTWIYESMKQLFDESYQWATLSELLDHFYQKNEHVKQFVELGMLFDKSIDAVDALVKQVLEQGQEEQFREVIAVVANVREQSRVFFASVNPGVQETQQFKNQIESGMESISEVLGTHRGWHGIQESVRTILGVLAAFLILPALIVHATTPGFSYTFFTTPETKSFQKLNEIKGGIKEVVDKLNNKPNQDDELNNAPDITP